MNTANLTYGVNGMVNEAVNFTTNAYYDFPFSAVSVTNNMSFFTWVNISSPASDSHLIGRWDGTSANSSFAVRVDNTGRLCMDVQTVNSVGTWNTPSFKRSCSTSKVAFATWHHVGVVRNGTTLPFYIDNKLSGTDSVDAGNFKATTLSLRVGAQVQSGINSGVEGLLDETALWTTNIPAVEREAVYARGLKDIVIKSESAPVDPGISPDHYWKFEGGSLADTFGGLNFTSSTATAQTVGGQVADFLDFLTASSTVTATTAPY